MNPLTFFSWIHKPSTLGNVTLSPTANAAETRTKNETRAERLEAAIKAARAFYDKGAKIFGGVLSEGSKELYKKSVEMRWNHIQKKVFEPLSEDIDKKNFAQKLGAAIDRAKNESHAAIQRLEIDAQRSEIVSKRTPMDPMPQIINRNNGAYILIRKAPPIENLVLRGGGAKGVSYGAALEQFEASGYLDGLKRIAGSSAGALTAACMACGVTASHFDQVESDKLFKSAITAYWNNPENNIYPDLEFADRRGSFKALSAVQTTDVTTAEQVHQYLRDNWNTEIFQQRLADLMEANINDQGFSKEDIVPRLKTLQEKPDFEHSRVGKMITFRDLGLLHQLAPETFRELTLTAWDPDNKCSIYFQKEKTPDIPICYAARISMSFPVGFKPVMMDIGDGQGKRTLLDGGVGTNLPTEVFIKPADDVSDRDALRNTELNNAKTLMFVFDMEGEAYRMMHKGNFESTTAKQAFHEKKEARASSLAGKFFNWFLGKDHLMTDFEDEKKVWMAGPNALPVFHDTISTTNIKISTSSAHAARLQAANAALEQIRARKDQAYFSEFKSLDELVTQLSEDEKAAIKAYAATSQNDPAQTLGKAKISEKERALLLEIASKLETRVTVATNDKLA